MTNIPYADNERDVWLKCKDTSKLRNKYFRSALRIDLFMKNEWEPIAEILQNEGFEKTKEGLTNYLEKWIDIMSPEYLMVFFLILYLFNLKLL